MENDTFLVPNSHELVNNLIESGNLETVNEGNENADDKGFVSILPK